MRSRSEAGEKRDGLLAQPSSAASLSLRRFDDEDDDEGEGTDPCSDSCSVSSFFSVTERGSAGVSKESVGGC